MTPLAEVKTLVVGGGLSGLAVADHLQRQNHDYLLLEARHRFGGRIEVEHIGGGTFDMGPAWFWPGQPSIAQMIDRFGLARFDQHAQGDLMFEDAGAHVQRGRGLASMEGSWRLEGGLAALTEHLANSLPKQRTLLNAQVVQLSQRQSGCRAILGDGRMIAAQQVVLALPPRLAAHMTFDPALPPVTLSALQSVPTWMAGQAKVLAVYDTPFWRDAGLSGDAMSRAGPMVEIHDASPRMGGPYALFGFVGVPPAARTAQDVLRTQVLTQLERLFGAAAATPQDIVIKDWAFDPLTATAADQAPLFAHPTYGLPPALQNIWGPRLFFAGTEVAPQFGGYVEGALEAADAVLDRINLD